MITSGFDQWAHTYDRSVLQPVFRSAQDAVLCRAQRLTACPRRVLDVGCGTGRLLSVASELFPHSILVGVDTSEGMLTVAGSTRPATRARVYIRAAAERLPFVDGSFDLVVSTTSFRHWTNHRRAMTEIRRVLAPSGLLGLSDLFAPRRRGFSAKLSRRFHVPPTIAIALAAAGLHPLSAEIVDGFGPVPTISVVFARHLVTRAGHVVAR
jgi:ubiquinone/menaquinone biosynthesis C-methylase UbiE